MDTHLTTMQVTALFIAGMCHALLGSIKVPLARKLEINESRVGGLISVFGFTLIPMAFAAGVFADKWGRDMVIVGGCALLILSVIVGRRGIVVARLANLGRPESVALGMKSWGPAERAYRSVRFANIDLVYGG